MISWQQWAHFLNMTYFSVTRETKVTWWNSINHDDFIEQVFHGMYHSAFHALWMVLLLINRFSVCQRSQIWHIIENHGSPFIRHSLVRQKLFLFPKRPVNCQKQLWMFQRDNHPGKIMYSTYCLQKSCIFLLPPRWLKPWKISFTKSHGRLYIKQQQKSAFVSSTHFKLSVSLLHFPSSISKVLKIKYEEELDEEKYIQPCVLQHAWKG